MQVNDICKTIKSINSLSTEELFIIDVTIIQIRHFLTVLLALANVISSFVNKTFYVIGAKV